MRTLGTTLSIAVAVLLVFGAKSRADKILIIGNDAQNESLMKTALESHGDTVTIGASIGTFDGSGLSGYNEVVLAPDSYASYQYVGIDMPTSGQRALLDFVQAGGGLITNEGFVQLSTPGYGPGLFQTLLGASPAAYESGIYTSNTPLQFSALTTDSVMNANLPSTFGFQANGIQSYGASFTESLLKPKAGAISFFSTNQWSAAFGGYGIGSGVLGWNYGLGRVVSMSTSSDNVELADPNYTQLLSNAVHWAGQDTSSAPVIPPPATDTIPPAVPEPSTGAVLVTGLLGYWIASKLCRNRRESQRIFSD